MAASLLTGIVPAISAEPHKKPNCIEVATKLEQEIATEPARVLLAVEDALRANDACACQVIKSAISLSKADPKLVGEIVSTAISTSPSSASAIGECALRESPSASKEIKDAMKNALGEGDGGGKEPITSGKAPVTSSPGKNIVVAPPPPTPESNDFDGYMGDWLSPSGIYFSVPGGGTSTKTTTETIIKYIKHCPPKKKRPPPHGHPVSGS